jgi:hypothetical protein
VVLIPQIKHRIQYPISWRGGDKWPEKPRRQSPTCEPRSKTNVGPDKDSDKRQLTAITAYAKASGFEVVATFYDAAVSARIQ